MKTPTVKTPIKHSQSSHPDLLTRRIILLVMNSRRDLVVAKSIVNPDMSMMCVLDIEQISALFRMILTAEEDIDLLERDMLGLWDEEEDKNRQAEIAGHEEEE
jgi:hypothetical protein